MTPQLDIEVYQDAGPFLVVYFQSPALFQTFVHICPHGQIFSPFLPFF